MEGEPHRHRDLVRVQSTSFWFAQREFRAYRTRLPRDVGLLRAIHVSKDPTNFVVLLEDGAALVGLTLAALGVVLSHALSSPAIDASASIAIGLVLALVALVLSYESRGLLIGESARRGVVREIRERAAKTPAGWPASTGSSPCSSARTTCWWP